MSQPQDQISNETEIYKDLYSVSQEIVSIVETEKALQKIIESAVDMIKATSGSVALLNPTSGKLEILASTGLDKEARSVKLDVGRGITGYVAATGLVMRVNDVSKDQRYISIRDSVKAEMACPIEIDDHLRGVINVDSDKSNAFTESHQTILVELASMAARLIDNAWRHEQVLHRASLFAALTRVGQTINSSITLEETLNLVVSEACKLIHGKVSSVMLFSTKQPGFLDIKATYGGGEAYRDARRKINLEDSLMGIVTRRQKPLQISNIFESSRYQNLDMAREEGLVAILSVPVKTADKILGTLNVYKGEIHNFSNEEVDCVSALAELAAIAIHRASLYKDISEKERLLNQNDKLSALGLLAAEVAHEIRNPLTVIKMLFHTMEIDFGESDPRTEDARIIRDKMDQLNLIVERVLRFARNAEPVISQIQLNSEIEDLLSLIRIKLDQRNILLEKNLMVDLPVIVGDSSQINQAILNIVLNAIEAMDNGGTLSISSSVTKKLLNHPGEKEMKIWIQISDTGKGFPEEIKEKLQSPILHSTKQTGTGIGLALVKKILDTHKAGIEVESVPGEGATINIYFQDEPQFD